MSLINQMLKDLEFRQQGAVSSDVKPFPGAGKGLRRGSRLLLIGLGVVLLLSGVFFRQHIPGPARVSSPADRTFAEGPAEQETAAAEGAAVASVAVSAEQPGADAALALSKNIALEAMRLREFDSFVHFEADFDRPPVYHLALAKDRRSLRIDLAAVESVAEMPKMTGQRWLQKLQVVQRDSGLVVKLVAKPQLSIRDFSATVQVAGGGYRLLLDLHPELPLQAGDQQEELPKAVESATVQDQDRLAPETSEADKQARVTASQDKGLPAPVESLQRTQHQPTAVELAGQACRQAQEALKEGRNREGEQALRQVLERQPAHLAARQALIAELLRQRRQDEARRLLSDGVSLHPEHLPLRMSYADLLVSQEASAEALDLLLAGPQPSPVEAPRLHALQAALYQRLGQYQAAAQEYRALLTTQPDNGLWWMGLAIAREHAGAAEEAVAAYEAALSGRGISPALTSYVQQRLVALRTR